MNVEPLVDELMRLQDEVDNIVKRLGASLPW